MHDFAIPSTGNPAKDEELIDLIILQDARQAENVCPNGCGPMTITDAHNRDCPVCGFHGWSNKPFTPPIVPVELPEQS